MAFAPLLRLGIVGANIEGMKNLRSIRARLKLTQEGLGAVMGCSQPNVWHYEAGKQPLGPERAIKLVNYAASKGLQITLDQVYDRAPLPPEQQAA